MYQKYIFLNYCICYVCFYEIDKHICLDTFGPLKTLNFFVRSSTKKLKTFDIESIEC